jgi:DNA-binding transcriptional MerR regulator
VRFIQRLKKLGLSLSEIKELHAVYGLAGSTHAMLVRLAELLDRHRLDVEDRIAELSAAARGDRSLPRRVELRIRAAGRGTGETA